MNNFKNNRLIDVLFSIAVIWTAISMVTKVLDGLNYILNTSLNFNILYLIVFILLVVRLYKYLENNNI
jgi:hypothetical protein